MQSINEDPTFDNGDISMCTCCWMCAWQSCVWPRHVWRWRRLSSTPWTTRLTRVRTSTASLVMAGSSRTLSPQARHAGAPLESCGRKTRLSWRMLWVSCWLWSVWWSCQKWSWTLNGESEVWIFIDELEAVIHIYIIICVLPYMENSSSGGKQTCW